MTLTPGVLSRRGVQLGGGFRYPDRGLARPDRGELSCRTTSSIEHSDRSLRAHHRHDQPRAGPAFRHRHRQRQRQQLLRETSPWARNRPASPSWSGARSLLYYDDVWRIRGAAAKLSDHRHLGARHGAGPTRACRASGERAVPIGGSNFELAFDSEAVNFLRGVGPTGVQAEFVARRYAGRTAARAIFSSPRSAIITPSTICRMRPSADSEHADPDAALCALGYRLGVRARRGRAGTAHADLEPRLVYSYVPYRNQDELPIFDTRTARSELDRTVPHQSICRRRPHRRCQPTGARG